MGYRSDVRIRLTKEDFERLKEEFEKRLIETNELEYSMFKNLDIYKEESDKTIEYLNSLPIKRKIISKNIIDM